MEGVRPLPLYSLVLNRLSDTSLYLFLVVGPYSSYSIHLEQKRSEITGVQDKKEQAKPPGFYTVKFCSEIDMTPTVLLRQTP